MSTQPQLIVVHRISVADITYPATAAAAEAMGLRWNPALVGTRWENTPEGIRDFFARAKGWATPAYHWLLAEDWEDQWGSVTQNVWHAGPVWNPRSIALATVHDSRRTAPPKVIWNRALTRAAEACATLEYEPAGDVWRQYGQVHRVTSHSELAESEGRVWQCPGKYWDMSRFRKEVAEEARRLRRKLSPNPVWHQRFSALGWR
jgi:hypothetical protein